MQSYYSIPLKPDILLKKERHPLTTLENAIRQHIHLLLKTHYEECCFDPAYGCYVWDKDFENIQSVSRWKDDLGDLVLQSLRDYEKRLSQVSVHIEIDEPMVIDPKTRKVVRTKKRITIRIRGTVKKTNQPLEHIEYMFFSPLSLA